MNDMGHTSLDGTSASANASAQPPAAGEGYISVRSLWKVFGKNPQRALAPEYASESRSTVLGQLGCVLALQDVIFDVGQGETFVVMGLSGCGKSTLLRCLVRLIEPTAGEVLVGGHDVSQYREKDLLQFRRSKVAMVFQHYGLLPHRRVMDNAAWGLEVQGVDKATRYARTQEVLDLVGLTGREQAYPRELSGGMQQRVGLARALVVDPDILLMDEPFGGLDPLIRRNMQDELVRLQMELRKTIVFITHDPSEALKIADRIAIMRDGRIVQVGTPEAIVFSPEDEYVGEFTQDIRRQSILTASSVMVEPKLAVTPQDQPGVVLQSLRSGGHYVAQVIDVNGNYIGSLGLEQCQLAAEDNVQAIGGCRNYLEKGISAVPTDTPFDQIVALSLTMDQPIPVVDRSGTLVGEIHRSAVAEAVKR